jgi:tetratricopeptide (TPR) repeat protein
MSDVLVTDSNQAPIVFRTKDLEVLFVDGGSSYLLITFNEAGKPGDGRHIWGESLVRSAGITTLGFMTRSANWFPEADMREAVAALKPFLDRFPERVLFGHSMGGYGAIKYSRLLGSSVAMSFCPQFSIKPDDVGSFDKRFLHCYRPEQHEQMSVSSADVSGEVYVFYDPCLMVDRENVRLIRESAPCVDLISMTNTGHGTITAFRGTIVATRLFELGRSKNLDAVRRYAAHRRRVHGERIGLFLNMAIKRHLPWAASVWKKACLDMPRDLATWFASHIAGSALQRGNIALGRAVLLHAVETFSNDSRMLESCVHLFLRAGDVQSATSTARSLTNLDPGNVAARVQLANLLNHAGDLHAAHAETLISLQIDPQNVAALRMMANLERRLNNPEQTIVWLRRAVAAQPDDLPLLVWLANTLLQTGALADARQLAQEALLRHPNAGQLLNLLANIAQRGGDLVEAVTFLRRATLAAPDELSNRTSLLHLLMQTGAFDDARMEAERILEVDPSNIRVLCHMVEIARQAQKTDEVAKWARAVSKAPGAMAGNLEWAAAILINANDLAGAQEAALSILGNDPSHPGALRCLADISSRSHKLDHAIVWARRAADGQNADPDRYYYLASLLVSNRDLTAARAAAQSALALQPDHAGALRCLADISARTHQVLTLLPST